MRHRYLPHRRQRGTVIIVTLWTITLLTILVTALAGQNRLSAQVARFHRDDLQTWAQLLAAINQAEMELLMETMPAPVRDLEEFVEQPRTERFRYDGRELELSYPQAEAIGVRIYDHGGKINIREISRPRMRSLIEKRLGEDPDPQQVDDLMTAWSDWLDLNDLAGPNGAERDYYLGLDPPYLPRNGALEMVEELLLIRGFAEVFADVDLDAAFTLYGESDLINLNIATEEAMQLLPGLDDELIDAIVAWRQDNEFVGNGDVAQLIPAESMVELRIWLNSRKTTNFFTIMAYPKGESTYAFAETVEVATPNNRPRVLKINPYQRLPGSAAAADTQDQ